MKKLIFCITALLFSFSAMAQDDSSKQPYVEVRGSAFTMLQPNKIEVSIVLNEADSKGKITLATMESSLATALKEAGIDASKQLVVLDQSSTAQKKAGAYQFKSFQLTLTTAQQVANVFTALEANNIANANITRLSNDKQAEVEKEVKIQAIRNAQNTARALAQAIGQTIGKALWIQDFSYSSTVYGGNFRAEGANRLAAKSMDAATLPQELNFQDIRIEQSVSVRFLLE